jgi:NDP-sugar pyrophosphorylase family protein
MQPTLLVLAAGMGSRYGGLKQIDPLGPSGETMLDYSVFDALRAGFGRVVFVIRREFEDVFRERIASKYAGRVPVDFVFQSLDALPPETPLPAGREKPWGTGHATWCARDVIAEPFAVINADDFYGADSFRQLAAFLARARADEAAMVGFRLGNTLSEAGAVSRGVCEVGPAGLLRSVTEHTGILASDVGEGRKLAPDTLVSMNCWGFTTGIFAALDIEFRQFLGESLSVNPLKAEFYLPTAVSALVGRSQLVARVLPTESQWFGVTYREDKPRVVAALADLVARGDYPAQLWPQR